MNVDSDKDLVEVTQSTRELDCEVHEASAVESQSQEPMVSAASGGLSDNQEARAVESGDVCMRGDSSSGGESQESENVDSTQRAHATSAQDESAAANAISIEEVFHRRGYTYPPGLAKRRRRLKGRGSKNLPHSMVHDDGDDNDDEKGDARARDRNRNRNRNRQNRSQESTEDEYDTIVAEIEPVAGDQGADIDVAEDSSLSDLDSPVEDGDDSVDEDAVSVGSVDTESGTDEIVPVEQLYESKEVPIRHAQLIKFRQGDQRVSATQSTVEYLEEICPLAKDEEVDVGNFTLRDGHKLSLETVRMMSALYLNSAYPGVVEKFVAESKKWCESQSLRSPKYRYSGPYNLHPRKSGDKGGKINYNRKISNMGEFGVKLNRKLRHYKENRWTAPGVLLYFTLVRNDERKKERKHSTPSNGRHEYKAHYIDASHAVCQIVVGVVSLCNLGKGVERAPGALYKNDVIKFFATPEEARESSLERALILADPDVAMYHDNKMRKVSPGRQTRARFITELRDEDRNINKFYGLNLGTSWGTGRCMAVAHAVCLAVLNLPHRIGLVSEDDEGNLIGETMRVGDFERLLRSYTENIRTYAEEMEDATDLERSDYVFHKELWAPGGTEVSLSDYRANEARSIVSNQDEHWRITHEQILAKIFHSELYTQYWMGSIVHLTLEMVRAREAAHRLLSARAGPSRMHMKLHRMVQGGFFNSAGLAHMARFKAGWEAGIDPNTREVSAREFTRHQAIVKRFVRSVILDEATWEKLVMKKFEEDPCSRENMRRDVAEYLLRRLVAVTPATFPEFDGIGVQMTCSPNRTLYYAMAKFFESYWVDNDTHADPLRNIEQSIGMYWRRGKKQLKPIAWGKGAGEESDTFGALYPDLDRLIEEEWYHDLGTIRSAEEKEEEEVDEMGKEIKDHESCKHQLHARIDKDKWAMAARTKFGHQEVPRSISGTGVRHYNTELPGAREGVLEEPLKDLFAYASQARMMINRTQGRHRKGVYYDDTTDLELCALKSPMDAMGDSHAPDREKMVDHDLSMINHTLTQLMSQITNAQEHMRTRTTYRDAEAILQGLCTRLLGGDDPVEEEEEEEEEEDEDEVEESTENESGHSGPTEEESGNMGLIAGDGGLRRSARLRGRAGVQPPPRGRAIQDPEIIQMPSYPDGQDPFLRSINNHPNNTDQENRRYNSDAQLVGGYGPSRAGPLRGYTRVDPFARVDPIEMHGNTHEVLPVVEPVGTTEVEEFKLDGMTEVSPTISGNWSQPASSTEAFIRQAAGGYY